jgi:hypothetical protein
MSDLLEFGDPPDLAGPAWAQVLSKLFSEISILRPFLYALLSPLKFVNGSLNIHPNSWSWLDLNSRSLVPLVLD